jgi:hypothetical protein
MLCWHMAITFADKFEMALAEKRAEQDGYGLRTLARTLAKDDPKQTEIIRRRLNKYRPKKPPNAGPAEVTPTAPTRWEIEEAMGLERDALAPDLDAVAASMAEELAFMSEIAPLRKLFDLGRQLERGELQVVKS